MNTNVLLSTAAVGVLIAGGAAYTMRSEPARSHQQVQSAPVQPSEALPAPRTRVERVMDPAGVSNSPRADQARIAAQEQKSVRVVYPNVVQTSDTQVQPPGPSEPGTRQPSAQPAPATTASSPPAGIGDNPQPAAQPPTTPTPTATTQTTQPGAQTSAPAGKGIVTLNAQQQSQVGQTIAQRNITPLTNVNFSIAIGTQVPRSVQLRALPSDLVTLMPTYRGYSYFVVEEQVMIVEPASHEIVAIVPYTGSAAPAAPLSVAATPAQAPSKLAKSSPMNSRPVSLNTEQRDVLRKHVKERQANKPARERKQTVQERAPQPATFVTETRREAPPSRRNRFIREDDDVLLDDEDRIVEQPKPFFGGWR